MPNELSKKTYPDGTEVYFRDDTAREQIANKFNNGVEFGGNAEKTITTSHNYDTLIVIGGYGSSLVYDVMFLNNTSGVAKLANQGATITSVDRNHIKYKPASEHFVGKVFSIYNATITVS